MDRYYESRVSEIYGGSISLIVLAILLVFARLVARKLSRAKFWWDDLLIVLALVSPIGRCNIPFTEAETECAYKLLCWGLNICYWLNVKLGGLGRHTTVAGGPVGTFKLSMFFKVLLHVPEPFHG